MKRFDPNKNSSSNVFAGGDDKPSSRHVKRAQLKQALE